MVRLALPLLSRHGVPYLRRLREMRDKALLTQSELADKAHMSPTTISDLETLKTKARPSTVRKLAAALNCEPRDLIDS
jgi:transcriptional regulator with XRE-family HTH domain